MILYIMNHPIEIVISCGFIVLFSICKTISLFLFFGKYTTFKPLMFFNLFLSITLLITSFAKVFIHKEIAEILSWMSVIYFGYVFWMSIAAWEYSNTYHSKIYDFSINLDMIMSGLLTLGWSFFFGFIAF